MRIGRREFILESGVLAAAALSGMGASRPSSSAPPNIILILADDLGYADVGFQGCRDIPTPNIDSLAKNGVRFTDGYVSSPLCSPSRAGIMTGRYQQRFGFWYNPGRVEDSPPQFGLPLSEMTLAEALKKVGYATGCVGKWHLGLKQEMRPMHRGFDEFFGFLHVMRHYLDARATPANPILRNDNPEPVDEKEYLTDAFTREAVDFVNRHKGGPFFLYLPYNAPHVPLEAPPAYLERFSSISDPQRRTYAAMIAALDDGVGRVLDALRKNSILENTLVIFLSDNGGPQGSPYDNGSLSGGKCDIREGGIRVPFLMQWPRSIAPGTLYEPAVSSLDIFPTCVAAAGGEPRKEPALDGVDLAPFLKGEKKGLPHETLFWKWYETGAVRAGKFKLMLEGKAPSGLYDLSQDKAEAVHLEAAHPDTVEKLQKAFLAWEAQIKPPLWPYK